MQLETALEFYYRLTSALPTGHTKGMGISSSGAVNQPRMSMSGRILISPVKPYTEMTPEERSRFNQGFGCIEINVSIQWGGADYDEQPLAEPRLGVLIIDRRERWDGPTWHGKLGQFAEAERREVGRDQKAVDAFTVEDVVRVLREDMKADLARL